MRGKLIAAGVVAFLIAFLAVLPARLLALFLPPNVATGTLTGSIWNGSTDAVAVNNRPLGPFKWKVRPLHLLRGKLALDGTLGGGEREASGLFAFGPGGSVQAWNVELRWPLAALPLNAIPPGWSGNIQATLREVAVEDGKVKTLLGIVDARNLSKPPPDSVELGAYRLTFDEASVQGDKLTGKLQDMEGPMQVTGSVTLGPGREFLLDGLVATRANAPQALSNTLRYLGEADGQGRRPFSVGGTY